MEYNILISLNNIKCSCVEFKTPQEGYSALNSVLKNEARKDFFLEVFPTLQSTLIMMLLSENSLNETHQKILGYKVHLNEKLLSDVKQKTLLRFFHLEAKKNVEDILILETHNIINLFELLNLAPDELSVLEHTNQRAHLKNHLYLSGNKKDLLYFTEENKNLISDYRLIEKPHSLVSSFFSFIEPS